MNLPIKNRKHSRNRGVTLVELLVVMAILAIITALLIPRLRIINKDRNIREAARIVGSTIAKASSRAVDDGIAGLIIERNDNFIDTNGVYYAATRMYLMRKLPPFAGDDENAQAEVMAGGGGNTMDIEIQTPLEHTAAEPLVQARDEIRLNYSSVRYQITAVTPLPSGKLELEVTLGLANLGVRPKLEPGDYPYVIYRQPRKLETSRVDLPDGYYVDLRLSGPLVPTPSPVPIAPDWERGSVFDDTTTAGNTVQLFFNGDGSISRYAYTNSGGVAEGIPIKAFHFFVTGYDPDSNLPPMQNPAAMWVTTDNATGSTNVAYNAPPPTGLTTVLNQAQYARGITSNRQSATQ